MDHVLPSQTSKTTGRMSDGTLSPIIVSDSIFLSEDYAPLDIYDGGSTPSHIVVSCPHAGRSYPASLLNNTRGGVEALRGLEDFGVDCLLHNIVSNETGIATVINRVARGYLDVNRAATALDKSMFDGRVSAPSACHHVRSGYGLLPKLTAARQPIYNELLSVDEAERRIHAVHTPYHNALAKLLDKAESWHGHALLVDFHSMPAFDRLNNRLPDIICGDAHGATLDRNKSEAITRFLREAGLSVSWNHPYAGGFITRGNGDARSSRQAVQIEINRGIYMDGPLRLNQSGTAALAKTMHDLVGFMRVLDPAC